MLSLPTEAVVEAFHRRRTGPITTISRMSTNRCDLLGKILVIDFPVELSTAMTIQKNEDTKKLPTSNNSNMIGSNKLLSLQWQSSGSLRARKALPHWIRRPLLITSLRIVLSATSRAF